MIPDRTTLVIACAIATVPLLGMPSAVQQILGLVYAMRALASHRRAVECYVRPSSAIRNSSTARCASSIA
jgi:hypothetical protein